MTAGLHLVGSVPLQSTEVVFREVSHRIGPMLRRIPDGETGERAAWTAWQGKIVERSDGVVRSGVRDVQGIPYPTYALKPGIPPDDVDFGNLGYADVAASSYADFRRLRADGVIQSDLRDGSALFCYGDEFRGQYDSGTQGWPGAVSTYLADVNIGNK